MDIKSLSKKSIDFAVKRTAEIIGIFLIVASILLFIALFSYSPEDPNYIFESGTITPLKSGQYIASVTLGSLQGTAPFYFDSDCVAYCDAGTGRILKETSEVIQ